MSHGFFLCLFPPSRVDGDWRTLSGETLSGGDLLQFPEFSEEQTVSINILLDDWSPQCVIKPWKNLIAFAFVTGSYSFWATSSALPSNTLPFFFFKSFLTFWRATRAAKFFIKSLIPGIAWHLCSALQCTTRFIYIIRSDLSNHLEVGRSGIIIPLLHKRKQRLSCPRLFYRYVVELEFESWCVWLQSVSSATPPCS